MVAMAEQFSALAQKYLAWHAQRYGETAIEDAYRIARPWWVIGGEECDMPLTHHGRAIRYASSIAMVGYRGRGVRHAVRELGGDRGSQVGAGTPDTRLRESAVPV